MQKNELILRKSQNAEFRLFHLFSLSTLTTWLKQTLAIRLMKKSYAHIFGMELTSLQTVYVLYAQLSGVLALMPFNINLGWRILFMVCFYLAVKQSGIMNLFKDE